MKISTVLLTSAFAIVALAPLYAQVADNAEDIFERGRQMVQRKQFVEASALWDSIANLKISPDHKAKYLAINGILQRDSLHNQTKAQQYFTQAEALYPEIEKLKSKEIEIGVIYASMGLAAQADTLKQYGTAITHYEKAIDFINNIIVEDKRGIGMNSNDLNLMLYSFEQSRAVDYGHNHQFEDAESAFEELKFNYGQMELSPDPEMVMQGWMFGCLSQQQYILMFENDMNDLTKALNETNALLNKLLRGLSSDDTAIAEGLSYQMPMFLYHAARINLKNKDADQALKLCSNAMLWTSADEWKPYITNIQGEALLVQGKEDEARKCWDEVLKLKPNFYSIEGVEHALNDHFKK